MKLSYAIGLLAMASSVLALAAPNEAKRAPEPLPQGACPDAGDVKCTPVPKRDIEARECGVEGGCTLPHVTPTKRAIEARMCGEVDGPACTLPTKRAIEERMCGAFGCTLPTPKADYFKTSVVDKRGACPDAGPCTPVPLPTKRAVIDDGVECPLGADCPPPLTNSV